MADDTFDQRIDKSYREALELAAERREGYLATLPTEEARFVRAMLADEVPLVLALLTPAMVAGSWSISNIRADTLQSWVKLLPVSIPTLFTALIALQGKLARVPFDAPEAETEVVAGPLTEYTGRRLAFIRLASRSEMVVGLGLLYDLFFPFTSRMGVPGFFVASLVMTFFLTMLRAVFGRLRIEDTTALAWRYLIPVSAATMALAIIVRG
jgi:NADH-quinone oxidoreductase subunit H